jgi:pyruvate/2-oxoglutarate/acetoin dehydrogenase E1 component
MSSQSRKLSFSLAINEALHQAMAKDSNVFLIGQGVKSPWYVGNTTLGLIDAFSEERIIDTPVSENAVTGAAVGAAIAGMRPVVVHPRLDFMLYALDPIINEAANWHYMFGGASQVPVVIWGIINRGGLQAAQHSQSLHALYAHIPGLKVVMPSTAYDAKGLLLAAIQDNNPIMFIDDRWLYSQESVVPEEFYTVPIGKGVVRKPGKDLTLVSISYLAHECVKAAAELETHHIDAEVIDLRTAKPIDYDLVFESVRKTGRVMVVDGGWKTCGFAAELSATISEECFSSLKEPVVRMTLPDVPAPCAESLEEAYYIKSKDIISRIMEMKIPVSHQEKVAAL